MHKRLSFAALVAVFACFCPHAQATVPSSTLSVSYTGNGATTSFAVPYRFLVSTDLVVTVAGVTKTIGTDYSVSGAGGVSGTVTFTVAPANAATVVIRRQVDALQKLSIRGARTFDAGAIENEFDKLAMYAQQNSLASGTVLDSYLANPYSGVGACSANTWASTLARNTAPTCTQPAFSNLSGVATSGQVPSLDASKITTGILPQSLGGTGAGALTCTGAAVTSNGTAYSCSPAVGFLNSINNWVSSQTFSGGLTFSTGSISSAGAASLASLALTTPLAAAQGGTGVASSSANFVLATPNGSSGALSPRALVAADVPSLPASQIGSGTLAAARLGLPTCSTSGTNALFFDGTTITCPVTGGGGGASLGVANTWTASQTFSPASSFGITVNGTTSQAAVIVNGGAGAAGSGIAGGNGVVSFGGAGNSGAGGNGGIGGAFTGGAGSSTNRNGTGISAVSGTGGTGTGGSGYSIIATQNNSIKEHINMVPVNADPSSPDPGGIWTLEDTVNATALKFRSTGIGAVTPKTYIMAPLVAASTSSFTSSTTVTLPSNNMTCVCGSTVSAQACATGISGTTLTITRTGTGVATYLCFMTQ